MLPELPLFLTLTRKTFFPYSFANYITYSILEGFPPSLMFITKLFIIRQELLHSICTGNSIVFSATNFPLSE